jgi:hypothetical protein
LEEVEGDKQRSVLGLSMGTERRYRIIVCARVEIEGKMGLSWEGYRNGQSSEAIVEYVD